MDGVPEFLFVQERLIRVHIKFLLLESDLNAICDYIIDLIFLVDQQLRIHLIPKHFNLPTQRPLRLSPPPIQILPPRHDIPLLHCPMVHRAQISRMVPATSHPQISIQVHGKRTHEDS